MRKNWFILLAVLVLGFATSCEKDQGGQDLTGDAVITLGLDIDEQIGNFDLKSGGMPEWTHPLNTITVVVMTNLDSDDVYTDTFTNIDGMSMVVPAGTYQVDVSNPAPANKADYLHFTAEKNVIVTGDATIIVPATLYQSLLTVSNAAITPQVKNTDLFYDQGMHFMYIIGWDGEWKYDSKKINTSVTPEIGKRYHYTITSNGIVVEGIGDWEDGNQSYIDRIAIEDLFNAENPDGFLYTDDASENLWKWTRDNTQGYANIANPIAVMLYRAGYEEAGLLGFESIFNFLTEQYGTAGTSFSSAAMYGLLSGYEASSNADYFDLAVNFFPQYMAKYPSDGSGSSPRDAYWGYDFYNLLFSAKMADDNGLTGASAFLTEWKATYLASYETKAADDYHRIFINAIAVEMGIGVHQGEVAWDETEYGLQEAAYGLMGNSWSNPSEVKSWILGNLETATYSEPLAEAIYALGL